MASSGVGQQWSGRRSDHPPSSCSSLARLNPTTASPSMTVTGVAEKPIVVSSSMARSSALMSFSVKAMAFWRRNSFTLPQNSQPGCE